MQKKKIVFQKGITELVVLAIMGLLAVVLPVATMLVQKNTENRSQAASMGTTCTILNKKECCSGNVCTCKQDTPTKRFWMKTETCTSGQKCENGACVTDVVNCDSWLKGDWSPAVCPSNGVQSRSVEKRPKNCSGNPPGAKPDDSRTCTPSCTEWTTGNWSPNLCPSSGTQTRNVGKKPSGCDGNPPGAKPDISRTCTPSCSIFGGECKQDSASCKYYFLGTVVSDVTDCNSRSQVCCKNVSGAVMCTSQGGECVANGTCTAGDEVTATGCTSTKPVCCKSKPTYEYKCVDNVLKKCEVNNSSNCIIVKTCTSNEICSAPLIKCVNKTTCKDGNTAVLVGDKRCIENRMKKCLESGSFDSGTPCGEGKECNLAGTACVDAIDTCTTITYPNKCASAVFTYCNAGVKASYNCKYGSCRSSTECAMCNNNEGCTSDYQCENGVCVACTAGQYKCDGKKLYECGSDRHWKFKKECGANHICRANSGICEYQGGGSSPTTNPNPPNPPEPEPTYPTETPTIPPSITGITLSPDPLKIKVGETGRFRVTTTPSGINAFLEWSIDPADVANIGENGQVFGKKVGEATVTVKVKGKESISDTVKVIVEPSGTGTPGPTGTVTPGPTGTVTPSDASISFKVAFAGIAPQAKCIDEYFIPETRLKLEVNNVPTNVFDDTIQSTFEKVSGEVDTKGYQVFKVTQTLDKNKFGSVNNFNYVKVKGPWHLKRRMCRDNQNGKIPETQVCSIDLKVGGSKVYDFSEYTLLAGDAFDPPDGIVDSQDLSYVKTRMDAGGGITCGIAGDLNMDGVVNNGDLGLVRRTLQERDDE